MRRLILCLLTVFGVASATNTASAQFNNPYGYGGYYPPSGLTNFPTVYNPWARYRNPYTSYVTPATYFNYAVQYNSATIFNPSLYPAYSFNNFGYQNFGVNQFNNLGVNQFNPPSVQQEVGGFVAVNRTTAINPVSGTILKPYKGVALTREGTFYQVPGTGSITAWGTYVPGSGVYVNPFTGTRYNPSTGLIVR